MAPTKKAAVVKQTGASKAGKGKPAKRAASPKAVKKSTKKAVPKSAKKITAGIKKPVAKKVSTLSKKIANVSRGSSLFTGDTDVPATRGKALTKAHYEFATSTAGRYIQPTNHLIRSLVSADFDPLPWSVKGEKPKSRVLTQKNNLPAVCGVAGCPRVGGFASAVDYQVHHDLHHQQWVCPEWRCCRGTTNNVFASESKLKSHRSESHQPGSMKLCGSNWWCSLCYAHVKTQKEWDEHCNQVHAGLVVHQEEPEVHGHRD